MRYTEDGPQGPLHKQTQTNPMRPPGSPTLSTLKSQIANPVGRPDAPSSRAPNKPNLEVRAAKRLPPPTDRRVPMSEIDADRTSD